MMYMQPLVIYINMEGMLQFFLDHIYAHISYTVLHLFGSFCSGHTDCIITNDSEAAEIFLRQVDR